MSEGRKCPECEGEGTIETFDGIRLGETRCKECDGTGISLTAEGEALVRFIRKYVL